ncbi:MAG: RNA polymerase sigma factor, RpoD/SigA family [Roseofilum sp. SBFL]|uniref:RNA polymerase sigma factor, RpoD/SigA family n=1 Tax=unclassified Roseofilum TaxID=2620099 RepID=UPI001B13468C|nr:MULTISPECIES: RNA polymerase sigma factor, RpoD/SigA family [unclassified Roseofilum]MBP0012847.1 RNA polymerase sigma factor, RpoD/SigA family [Roseofilum sp. SID3]MBP0025507.1 RNA polymerase sigma factor, RpoD/SigA family [Roseofilum sp. SID2]MBP0037942.1 RNA polymerase sigma factor, RpoD/SigA family [Roseofilum sp. SID1]MBP0041590.1 RNA polymerase sigma factor, RpoD/SigA family [Roseofilum sp. SBFL]
MLNRPENNGLIDREYDNPQANTEAKGSVLNALSLSPSDPEQSANSLSTGNWVDSIAFINEDTVGLFLKEMARYPLLSAEEEVILSRQVQEGIELQKMQEKLLAKTGKTPTITDLARTSGLPASEIKTKLKYSQIAKQKIVRSNLRLVVSIAKRYVNRGVPFLDLIQEGALGLNRAAEKFDPEKGYKFSTYAYWWIRQGITRTLANHGRTVRLPIHVVEKLNKMRVMQQQLRQELERSPSEGELAEALEISIPQLRYLHQVRRRSLSLNHRFGEDQDTELLDLLEDQGTQSPETLLSETMMRQEILSVLSDVLTEREKDIISLRYGLSTGKPYTLEEVSHLFNLSRERVRQIQTKAMRKLRRPQVAQRLKAWLR